MRPFLFLLPAILTAGCASSGATCGWRFEVGKAGQLYQPVPYQQGMTAMGVTPVGAVGLDSRVSVLGATRYSAADVEETLPAARLVSPLGSRKVVSPPADCTMEEICILLRALAKDRGINTQGMKQMPKE